MLSPAQVKEHNENYKNYIYMGQEVLALQHLEEPTSGLLMESSVSGNKLLVCSQGGSSC